MTTGRGLGEAETAGYLVRRRVPPGGGRIATRTFFLDAMFVGHAVHAFG